MTKTVPHRDQTCRLCPRLAEFLDEARAKNPDWHNAPVNGYGPVNAPIMLIGLAPGMRGANRTGRPFTGDFAGDLLFQTLAQFDLSTGQYDARPDDGVELTQIRIVNAVRCVPPQNKPIGAEINTCRQFLTQDIAAMTALKVIITLGRIGHQSALKALGLREKDYPFSHGGKHLLPNGVTLISSYHCSRYNTQTNRLTTAMFHDVFHEAVAAAGLLSAA
ncbi:MAG: uracil-DNA glycosylase [Alphaproteobacteria bacterium]|nr:uracil-DNA glycosylase [Alphaproteobacteria bacterium]